MQLALTVVMVVWIALPAATLEANQPGRSNSHIRFNNLRIAELFRHGIKRSPSFRDLAATLEILEPVVYVEDGQCPPATSGAGCLRVVPASAHGRKHLFVRFDARQPLRRAVSQLAHELYHAVEVGREPDVVDQASLSRLYARIGFRSCGAQGGECWETRAAAAFEALVMEELVNEHPGASE